MTKKYRLSPDGLERLIASLHKNNFTTIGPALRESTIVYDTINSTDDLPIGWGDEQAPGSYRLKKRNDGAFFGYTLPPQSWKRFLYPPTRRLFTMRKYGKSLEQVEETGNLTRYALIGPRACELAAITVQDKVFTSGDYRDTNYASLRERIFIVAVNCSQAGANCFCASMKTGPEVKQGFDIVLTEVIKDGQHFFIAESGSDAGSSILSEINAREASDKEIHAAEKVLNDAAAQIEKKLDTRGIQKILADNLEHPHWDDVAKRCMTCGNCTMVCPTCFCSTVEDSTDLSGQIAERTRRWDSCFTMDFAKVSGGNFRVSPKSRYRQWLTHKFSSWIDQFGVAGCVGCGRCITWCPVGIDVTAEVKAIRSNHVKQMKGG